MATFRTMSGQSFTLGSSISSTQTTILLSSFKVPVTGTDITMASMGTSIAFGTLAPGTSSSELISFTGVTQNSDGSALLTGVTRGLDKEYPGTEDTTFKQPHAGQTIFILSDAPQVFNQYTAKVNAETITGKWTFPAGGNASAPVSGSSYTAPTDDLEYASKKYVDDIAIAGSPDATTTIKGIVQVAAQAEVLAKTALGGTGASLSVRPDTLASTLLSDYKADTGAANAYVITPVPAITAYTVGQIFSFKATNANTTTSTLNVNGLGAKTINKAGGATALSSGDIAAGMIVLVEYDGTNFVMLNPVANAPTTAQLTTNMQTFTTAGTTSWTKPTGASIVDVYVIGGGGAGGAGAPGNNNGGGAGGGWGYKRFFASALGSTESLTVGAGGTPVANTSGNPGGATTFGTTTLLRATGGGGGTTGTSTGGTANGDIFFSGGNGGQSSGTAPVGSTTNPSPRGGGGAGYNGASPATPTAGQAGGAFITNYVRAGAAGGASSGANGSNASAATVGLLFGGVGGGGAGYNGGATGGNGGNGNLGSGGGGAIVTGNTGGTGGDGAVIVISYI